MRNQDRYTTAEERSRALIAFCRGRDCRTCPARAGNADCRFAWLDLEDEVEKPMQCPFCGSKCTLNYTAAQAWVECTNKKCNYESGYMGSQDETIAAHNRVARAVMAAKKEGEGK